MKKFRIDYYKTRNWIHFKIIEANDVASAIKKAKVKNIVEVRELE